MLTSSEVLNLIVFSPFGRFFRMSGRSLQPVTDFVCVGKICKVLKIPARWVGGTSCRLWGHSIHDGRDWWHILLVSNCRSVRGCLVSFEDGIDFIDFAKERRRVSGYGVVYLQVVCQPFEMNDSWINDLALPLKTCFYCFKWDPWHLLCWAHDTNLYHQILGSESTHRITKNKTIKARSNLAW